RCVFTMPDKMSQEKARLLRALGAEVIITPTAVPPDHPENYIMKGRAIAAAHPNAIFADQHYNPVNPEVHYRTTGPELWEQTREKITHFVCAPGTGGTVSGAGRFLKEKNPRVQVVAGDPAGSIYTEYARTRHKTEGHPYKVEGIGGDKLPTSLHWDVIDEWITVSDKDAMLMVRRLAKEEALFAGGSTGVNVVAALDVARRVNDPQALVVTVLADTGERYLSKVFNDEWLREKQILTAERAVAFAGAAQIVEALRGRGHTVRVVDTVTGLLSPTDEQRLLTTAVGREPPAVAELDGRERAMLSNGLAGLNEVTGADVLFLCLHAGRGEGGILQAVLDVIAVPYTGSGALASALAMDKDLAKRLFRAAGVPVPAWFMAPVAPEDVTTALGWPVIVKPSKMGSSVGMTLVHNAEGLDAAVELATAFDTEVMAEQFIPGRELTVGAAADRRHPRRLPAPGDAVRQPGVHRYARAHVALRFPAAVDVCHVHVRPRQPAAPRFQPARAVRLRSRSGGADRWRGVRALLPALRIGRGRPVAGAGVGLRQDQSGGRRVGRRVRRAAGVRVGGAGRPDQRVVLPRADCGQMARDVPRGGLAHARTVPHERRCGAPRAFGRLRRRLPLPEGQRLAAGTSRAQPPAPERAERARASGARRPGQRRAQAAAPCRA